MNPISYIRPDGLSWALYGLNIISTRANLLGASDVLDSAALDKYSFVRNAYLQRRKYLLSDGSAAGASDQGAPLPKYEDVEEGAAAPAGGAAAAPGGQAPAPAPKAAAPATPAAPGASAPEAASAAAPASGAEGEEQTHGGQETQVPAGQIVPPKFNFPSFRLR